MSLTLYMHPLSSYCWKVLVALYENETPFTPKLVDFQNAVERAEFNAMWPIGKFPVLRDSARHEVVAESTIIIEYLSQHYPGNIALVPKDAESALAVRRIDRFYDLHIHTHMQKCSDDNRRPADKKDPVGVAYAKAQSEVAYGMIDKDIAGKEWATGDEFTMADCAACPALFYGHKLTPIAAEHKNLHAYLRRLQERPSFARVLQEAEPYFSMFPANK